MPSGKWLSIVLAVICLELTSTGVSSAFAADKKCLFVSSYRQGYEWSDGVERGLRSVVEGKCEYRQFDMDTKRRKSSEEKPAGDGRCM